MDLTTRRSFWLAVAVFVVTFSAAWCDRTDYSGGFDAP